MIKLAALNEDWSDDSSSEPTEERVKENQESEALELYNKALQYQHVGNYDRAKEFYDKLLTAPFVVEADEKNDDVQSHPGLTFKYSAYKNLATVAEEQSDLENAIDLYLEAAAIDDSDVTLWCKIGKIAVKLSNVRLARYAFEQGLNCNSKHWPCLDELISVLYAIGDYHACLKMISTAFERDTSYPKGLIFRDKIYNEYDSFRQDYRNLRGLSAARNGKYEQVLANQMINDALDLRKRNSQRNQEVIPPPIIPAKHLPLYTWCSLGECLVSLYKQVTSDDNSLNLCQKVNLENYSKIIIPPDVVRNIAAQKSYLKDSDDKRSATGVKRKRPLTLENDSLCAPKRRSARVSKSKKKQEEVNYLEILQEFLPNSLKNLSSSGNTEDDSMNMNSQDDRYDKTDILSMTGASCGQDASTSGDISSENEPLDVQNFVKQNMENCGTLDLLCNYSTHLKNNCNLRWSSALVDVYLQIYSKIRPHLSQPSVLCRETTKKEIMGHARLVLVAVELTLDRWCTEKSKSSSSLSPAGSPRGATQLSSNSPLKDSTFHGKYFLNDMEYIAQAAAAATNLGEKDGIEFTLRVNWAKVRFMMFQGKMDLAVIYLDRCKTLIELSETPITIHLVNCKADNLITIGQVRKKLESLQRCQSLEEVHRLYELEKYQDVVDVLLSSLHQPPPITKVGSDGGMSIPERPAQLLLLQDSLLKLKDYRTCLSCSEVAFNEAVGQMTPCEAWSTTLERIFHCVNTILNVEPDILDSLSGDKLHRLTQNLMKVIEVSMEPSETATDVPLATVMPWILLYKVIASTEDESDVQEMEVEPTPEVTKTPEATDNSEPQSTNKESVTPIINLPLSLQFLRLAHEALGGLVKYDIVHFLDPRLGIISDQQLGRSWCVNNDGLFLRLYVDVFMRRLREKPNFVEKNKDKFTRELEQCFFCLYGHPSKKAKARGLQEHGSTQIPLTWANAVDVYEFFKPATFPSFEDKTYTVTSEVQNLLRRITLVVPQNELEVITVESVQNFIDGTSDIVPTLPDNVEQKERSVSSGLFYLLADSYFKNKEFSKAIKFYIHDICSNPNRFDTWAAMALARQVRLEDKLRACEQKSEGPVQKHSVSTLRCFKRALEIDSSNTNLWGEYGSLSYCLHSYASRQLSQVDSPTPENRKVLEDRRTDMLKQAKQCFNEALYKPDNDEPWLQCYMLGKIYEKLDEPPEDYLEFYLKALTELDKDGAEYPRKIAYHNPPNLALEVLEVAFRFHASVLKLLMKPDISTEKYEVVARYLDQASKCPFYEANDQTKDNEQTSSQKVSQEKKADSEVKVESCVTLPLETPTADTSLPGCVESRDEGEAPPCSLPDKDTPNTSDASADVRSEQDLLCDEVELSSPQDEQHVESGEGQSAVSSPSLVQRCLKSLAYCLMRFPQHYKSQYRLAHAYHYISAIKNSKLSRDLLLGSNISGEKPFDISVQGLLNEKSKTNLFQGIWRIPLDDVDRPGSFCTHMLKSVKLLIDVLTELEEWDSLLLVSALMYRSPDAGKKYLRDNERLQLASKAYSISFKLLNDRLQECEQLPSPNAKISDLLTDAHEVYKWSQKLQKYGEEAEKFLSNVYKLSGVNKNEKSGDGVSLLEEALKYFQQQSKLQTVCPESAEEKTAPKMSQDSETKGETEVLLTQVTQKENTQDSVETTLSIQLFSSQDTLSQTSAPTNSQPYSQPSDNELSSAPAIDAIPVLVRDVKKP